MRKTTFFGQVLTKNTSLLIKNIFLVLYNLKLIFLIIFILSKHYPILKLPEESAMENKTSSINATLNETNPIVAIISVVVKYLLEYFTDDKSFKNNKYLWRDIL